MSCMFRHNLTRYSIFAGLDGEQLRQISPFFVECCYPKGVIIFDQGRPAVYLYILLAGKVLVRYKPYDGPMLDVAQIQPGGVFGWSAALHRDVYTSAAVAVENSVSYRIRREDLQVICKRYPETGKILLERLASVIAERLRSTHSHVFEILRQEIEGQDSDLDSQKDP
jgi:CRP/FNR family transcriptional regulator, cyclic AMP receptor protein